MVAIGVLFVDLRPTIWTWSGLVE